MRWRTCHDTEDVAALLFLLAVVALLLQFGTDRRTTTPPHRIRLSDKRPDTVGAFRLRTPPTRSSDVATTAPSLPATKPTRAESHAELPKPDLTDARVASDKKEGRLPGSQPPPRLARISTRETPRERVDLTRYRRHGTPFLSPGDDAQTEAMSPGRSRLLSSAYRRNADSPLAVHMGIEEVWVIERPATAPAAAPEGAPRQGELRALVEDRELPLPLRHTWVHAQLAAHFANVAVKQRFVNPREVAVETVYAFPLPRRAAVSDFVMTIGNRHIRGVIRERDKAAQVYEEARRQGYRAALIREGRPGYFVQKVANIGPRKTIDVQIQYFQTLASVDGEIEFTFPARCLDGGETRSGRDLSLHVDVNAGLRIDRLYSPSHTIWTRRPRPSQALVSLQSEDRIANRDFVLRCKTSGNSVRGGALVHRDGKGSGTFALVIQPPESMRYLPRTPRELIFVVDCSERMSGWPMRQSVSVIAHYLRRLQSDDTFHIVESSGAGTLRLAGGPLTGERRNVCAGLDYVDQLSAEGSGDMPAAVRSALTLPHDPERLRMLVLITDGEGATAGRLSEVVRRDSGGARVFCVGIGRRVRRERLEAVAVAGKGAVAFLSKSDEAASVIDGYHDLLTRPALTDLVIQWPREMHILDVYPSPPRDLLVGRPIVLVGRFEGRGRATVRISGRCGERRKSFDLPINLDADAPRNLAISKVWAAHRIAALAQAHAREPSPDNLTAMCGLSVNHKVLAPCTAFLSIDALAPVSTTRRLSIDADSVHTVSCDR